MGDVGAGIQRWALSDPTTHQEGCLLPDGGWWQATGTMEDETTEKGLLHREDPLRFWATTGGLPGGSYS